MPDFVAGTTTGVLFLRRVCVCFTIAVRSETSLYCLVVCSLRFHVLHPDYVFVRLREMGQLYKLRVLLVLVDMVRCICGCGVCRAMDCAKNMFFSASFV